MTEIPDTPEELIRKWKFQEGFEEIALELMVAGAHLGALAMARNVLLLQMQNRTLRKEDLLELIEAVKLEVRETTKNGITDARGA